jgi:hypothetical protein
MWPFRNHRHRGARAPLRHPREPRLADGAAYARCFAQWSDSAHGELVRVHQLGYLRPSDKGKVRDWRPWPPLPMLQIVVEPGESIDFADPETGFPGFGHRPPPERVLRLWADDLLTVSHGNEWTFVIDVEKPFEPAWLDMLTPPLGATYEFWHAVVSASFAGPTPQGNFRLADVDATTYLTRVHIEDHRDGPPAATAVTTGARSASPWRTRRDEEQA